MLCIHNIIFTQNIYIVVVLITIIILMIIIHNVINRTVECLYCKKNMLDKFIKCLELYI
jgi:hypothetical protein